MNSNKPIALALFFGILIGCASSQVTQIATVGAQSGSARLSRCVVYALRRESEGENLDRSARGIGAWTPVGGTEGGVVLCR